VGGLDFTGIEEDLTTEVTPEEGEKDWILH